MIRNILIGIAALAAVAALYWFLTAPSRARKETAVATATAATAEASKAAAQDTVQIVVDTQAAHGRIDVVTQGNRDAILAASGATAPVDVDLHNTGLRAICLRDAYRLQPSCQRLLDPGAEVVGGPDAGGAAPR